MHQVPRRSDPEGRCWIQKEKKGVFAWLVDGVDKGFRLEVGDVLLPVTVPLLFRPFDPEETTFEFPEFDPTPAIPDVGSLFILGDK